MLGLTSHEPHFSLLREEVRFGGKDSQKRWVISHRSGNFHQSIVQSERIQLLEIYLLFFSRLSQQGGHFVFIWQATKFLTLRNWPVTYFIFLRSTAPEETTFHLLHLSLLREYIDFEFSSLKVCSGHRMFLFSFMENLVEIFSNFYRSSEKLKISKNLT